MAIYHSRVKVFSRSRGDSAVAAAAYRAGLLLIDPLTGQRHDYRRRGGVVTSECLAPQGAPDWALVPGELWPAAEAAENRKNSVVAREFEVALPHELNDEQRSELTTAIGQALVARYGFAVQASIHSPGSRDGLNHHVHLLATTRRLTPEGFAEKTRELDGGASGKIEIEWVRHTFASTINAHLAAAGIDARVDHRRLEVQAEEALARGDLAEAMALSRQPTKHLGKAASALERRGVFTELGAENARIARENEAAFEQLLAEAEREGKAVPVPGGHSHAQAQRDLRHRSLAAKTPLTPVPGLEIHGLSGVRPSSLLGSGERGETEKAPPLSIGQLFADATRDLAEILALRSEIALAATRRLLQQLMAWAVHGESADLRRDLTGLVQGLGWLKRRLTRFAQRVAAVGRAERLFHLAEQSWEAFDAAHPNSGHVGAPEEWARGRSVRLAALRKRTVELRAARAAASTEVEAACEAEVTTASEQLERWSKQASARYVDPTEANAPALPALQPSPAPVLSPQTTLTPRSRRPRP
ncbi:plasmid mobilization protein [Xanthomonas translucens pv. arrhenatheri]|uniref:MobA/MobL family protein n=1 Tax=Xanthomonas graminis pv. arrhenatheri LMG 727 TaxID=1195923 RepID=A0A0K3A0F7_9XANT|nr:MobQ family relaxase [Xanthomonas translucens]OAX65460.1 plasmid mobilization protein [Xanthomonas translucens pv. arrhenatheri]UKE78477.1 MobA/MobL family protein [Xanthomonas translucens pv. arrhenatheri]CTP91546.1 MobA/MobL family protein [Xanthomonas translucens pv. arrhenatheri LMG 727]